MAYLETVRYLFEKARLGEVAGCHPEQVAGWERSLGQALPEAYREYLLWMGIDSGRFLRGSYCQFRHRQALTTGAAGLMQRHEFRRALPADAFVFWAHQGYQFLFFRLSEGPDPPVHYFNGPDQREDFVWNQYDSFSEFLAREVVGHAQLLEEITGRSNGIRQFFPRDVAVHPREYDAEIKAIKSIRQQLETPSTETGAKKPAKFTGMSYDPICIACEAAAARLMRDFPHVEIVFKEARQAV